MKKEKPKTKEEKALLKANSLKDLKALLEKKNIKL